MSDIERIKKIFTTSAELKQKVAEIFPKNIEETVEKIVELLKNGGRIFTCGNGGSNCDAQHIAGELVVRFYKDRPPIPAIALETNPGVMTAVSNDFSYKESFSRSAEAFMQKGDILIALSTSGNSPNILEAIDIAKKKGSWILGLSGKTGGKMAEKCDKIFLVPTNDTPRIQEVHITIAHALCELIEEKVFQS